MTAVENAPYRFDPASPLYAMLAQTCLSLTAEHVTDRDVWYTTVSEHIFAHQTRRPLSPEQWKAATASWHAATIAANAPIRPWHTAMARIAHCAQASLHLPEGSPFLPICIQGPGNCQAIVSIKALEEAFGWKTDCCPAARTFGKGLNFSDLSASSNYAILRSS